MTTECHRIEKTDHLVLTGEKAWHGLGTVVEEAPTPGQALSLAKLDWEVEEHDIATGNGLEIESHKALTRSDTGDLLSVVGHNYRPLQNDELAMFCYDVADKADVRIETAGSLRGGKRVWFLIRGDTLFADKKELDATVPYMMLYNSHDQSSSLEFMPSGIRVVCQNTMTLARERSDYTGMKFKHTQSLLDRVQLATHAIREGFAHLQTWNDKVREMNTGEISDHQANDIMLNAYDLMYGKPSKAVALDEKKSNRHSMKRVDRVQEWKEIHHRELQTHNLARTAWTTANAVTNWIDHDMKVKLNYKSSHNGLGEAREFNNWFGMAAKHKAKVMSLIGC